MFKKKFFAKALAFAMVMGSVGIHGLAVAPVGIVKAADEPIITFDPVTYEATIEVAASVKSGYVCLKVLKEDKLDAKVVSESWYPVKTVNGKNVAIVDLSFLKAAKPSYIMAVDMLGNKSASVTTIAAQTKTAIKYDAKTKSFVDKSKAPIDGAELANYEYKTLYGSNWGTIAASGGAFTPSTLATFKTDKLENAVVAGTTLVVRKAASKTAGSEAPAGTEVKVKIPAVAKAPKVKVDYVKGVISLPKGVEVCIVDTTTGKLKQGGNPLADLWGSATGKLTQEQILTALQVAEADTTRTQAMGYTFAIRTAEIKDKKAASKIDFIKINPAPIISPDTTAKKVQVLKAADGTTKEAVFGYTFEADGLEVTPDPNSTVNCAYSLDGRKWVPITGGVTIKVEDKAKVQFYVPAEKGSDTKAASFASNIVEITYAKPASNGG